MSLLSGILVVDKPAGFTSHDVVAKMRGILRERRIGHAGTLDPMATGVLPLFIGAATKAVPFLPGEKSYAADFILGMTTDTQDSTGRTLSVSDVRPGLEEMCAGLEGFRGEIWQTPPMMSAVKVGGVRLYRYARQGIEVERQPRRVIVSALTLDEPAPGTFTLCVTCSAGFYVRTLIHDLGQVWGCGAVMTGLRRLCAGPYTLEEAHTLEDISGAKESGRLEALLIPLDSLFSELPCVMLDTHEEIKWRNGMAVMLPEERFVPRVRVYAPGGRFLSVGVMERVDSGARLRTEKNFFG